MNRTNWWLVGALALVVMLIALARLPYYFKARAMRLANQTQAERIAAELERALALKVAGVKLDDLYLPCAGKQTAPFMNKEHPTAELRSSNITPTSDIAAGQVMHATAKVECPAGVGLPVLVHSTCIGVFSYAPLYDDGTHGDHVARDGLWEVDVVWDEDWFEKDYGWAGVCLGMKNYAYIAGIRVELNRQSAAGGSSQRANAAEAKQ